MPMQTNALAASSAWSTANAPRPAKADLETDRPLVLIVDDDEDVRSALRELLLSVGIGASCDIAMTVQAMKAGAGEKHP